MGLLYNGGSWTNDDSTIISKDTWYKIEIKYDDNNNTSEWRLSGLDGTILYTQNGSLTGVYRTGIRYWNLGFIRPGTDTFTGTIYFDLIKVNTLSYQ